MQTPLPCDTRNFETPAELLIADRRLIMAQVARFQSPQAHRSVTQAVLTFAIYGAVLASMYAALHVSVWLTLALVPVAAGMVVRIFIIQHDCGHGSLFRARWANQMLGRLCSVVTLTPFANWRRQHAQHHAVWNNLGARGGGVDIYSGCMTVAEYRALPRLRRWGYRITLHPLVAQLLIPPLVFLLLYRLPFETPAVWRHERRSVWLTNLSIGAVYGALVLGFGVVPVLLVQLPAMVLAAVIGVWLFTVQHRFEDVRWLTRGEWEPLTASVQGCSYLRLPRVLQWFTGSIGFHHIHHLAPRVPNYRLAECHAASPGLALMARAVSLKQALTAWRYALWDETAGRMVGFAPRNATHRENRN